MVNPLVHVALLEPKIPQNTGNVDRTVLACGGRLHLIEPLGFATDEKAVRRAGLDYWQYLDWAQHPSYARFREVLPAEARVFGFTTRGDRSFSEVEYRPGDCLLFGDEVRGLPSSVLERCTPVRIPILDERVRSLNLSNAVAVALLEFTRQLGYPSLEGAPCSPS